MNMNYAKNFYAVLPIFTVLLFLALFGGKTSAQTVSNKKPTEKQKGEEAEIRKFSDEFVKNLEETGDLAQVSEKFFVPDFKTRMAKNSWLHSVLDEDQTDIILNDDEIYNDSISFINFMNLLSIVVDRKKFDDDNEDSDEEQMRKSLPPQIVELFARSKWLRLLFDEDANSKEPETLEDYRSFTADLNTVSDALRLEISKRHLRFPDDSKTAEYFPGEACEGERCLGLPEKTMIFAIHRNAMCLRIVKVNGEFKIANVFSLAEEE